MRLKIFKTLGQYFEGLEYHKSWKTFKFLLMVASWMLKVNLRFDFAIKKNSPIFFFLISFTSFLPFFLCALLYSFLFFSPTPPFPVGPFSLPISSNWLNVSVFILILFDRLTPDQRSKQGAIWNKVPCKVRNWEIQVQFKVTGTTKAWRGVIGDQGFQLRELVKLK